MVGRPVHALKGDLLFNVSGGARHLKESREKNNPGAIHQTNQTYIHMQGALTVVGLHRVKKHLASTWPYLKVENLAMQKSMSQSSIFRGVTKKTIRCRLVGGILYILDCQYPPGRRGSYLLRVDLVHPVVRGFTCEIHVGLSL